MQNFIRTRQLEERKNRGNRIGHFLMELPLFWKFSPFPPLYRVTPGTTFENMREFSQGISRSKQVLKLSYRSENWKFVKNRGNWYLKIKIEKKMKMSRILDWILAIFKSHNFFFFFEILRVFFSKFQPSWDIFRKTTKSGPHCLHSRK